MVYARKNGARSTTNFPHYRYTAVHFLSHTASLIVFVCKRKTKKNECVSHHFAHSRLRLLFYYFSLFFLPNLTLNAGSIRINPLTTNVAHHIETSQLTGFYMMVNIDR